ncbi:ATP-binding protein [Streptomyces sp. NA04227]|uniref:ATP-binding protein n=1 Tax=Streptomyces sp. NA04227 TaxID=2742136 RepID=UPI001591C6A9|nr:ATP-binding protein [Streptomyces sp. NA04227]QKW08031.1 ATP-binding protein [Streptomyces sp. NA04227]
MNFVEDLPSQRYEQQLRAHPDGIPGVRRAVTALLTLWGREAITDTVNLCVTELLANVGAHASSPECVLTLHNHPDRLRASVRDTEPALPVVKQPDFLAENGRGMYLVSESVDKWGADPVPTGGKEVWFELRTGGASS